MKKKFIVKIYSSEESVNISAGDLEYEIYEYISDIDTVEVTEVPFE